MIFHTADPKLRHLLDIVCEHLHLYSRGPELTVEVKWASSPDQLPGWKKEKGCLHIVCRDAGEALMLIGRGLTQNDKAAETLEPRFSELAAMLDVSRNAVYTLPALKTFLCQLAMMGYTACYLYMEDTYELPGYPYFGYRRGRYSVAEQKELDQFAQSVGIELIPCIQTLAHLRTAIRWGYMQPMRDTIDNLMVGHPETEALVEAMIAHFSKTFHSRRIHLGMDEAVSLGTGRYLRSNGYRDHRDILMEHLHTVCRLCDKYGMQPMIWDDMLFRDRTPLMNYYGSSAPVSAEEAARYPDNLTFVYWDYYHDSKEEYEEQIRRRGNLKMAFAGGVWKWGGWVPNLTKSFQDSIAAAEACHQQGVQNILVTLWGDDGDETPLATVLPGLALYGLLRFGSAVPRQTDPFCRLFSDLPLAAYELMEKMDLIPGMPQENLEALIPHKLLLYGDMASELFQPVLTSAPDGLAAYYEDLSAQYAAHAQHTRSEGMQRILRLYQCLAQVLSARCTAAAALQTAGAMQSGRGGKKRALTAAAALLSEMETRVEQLHQQTVEVWSQERKGQGMEILDLRLGGIAARCKALRKRIELYNTGRIENLSELEEPFLPYQGILSQDGHTPGREAYGEIVTANTLCHQFSI